MASDRQRVLLAVLRARGPAHPADLTWHPVIRDHYNPFNDRYEIEDDLEPLVEAVEVVAINEDVDGDPATIAYDIADVEREDRARRIDRARKAVREHRRRSARRE